MSDVRNTQRKNERLNALRERIGTRTSEDVTTEDHALDVANKVVDPAERVESDHDRIDGQSFRKRPF